VQLSKHVDVAKRSINGSHFDGKSSHYTFNKFVLVHKDVHAEPELLDVNEPYLM
jgi:hypothetical protein